MEKALIENDPKTFILLMKDVIQLNATLIKEEILDESVTNENLERKSLEKLRDYLSKATALVVEQLKQAQRHEILNKMQTSQVILKINEIQCFEPRGRFNLIISDSNINLEGKQFSVVLPINEISHIACVPSNATTKKEGEDILAIRFEESVMINNKPSKHILMNLSRITAKIIEQKDSNITGTESDVITSSIQLLLKNNLKIAKPQKNLFCSTLSQKSFIRCYKGTQEGAIYPLINGVVFVKPLLFIPIDEIASLSAGRGGGSGNTRYVDLKIETADNKVIEFTNIERDELPAIQMYVKSYLERRSKLVSVAINKSEPLKENKENIQNAQNVDGSIMVSQKAIKKEVSANKIGNVQNDSDVIFVDLEDQHIDKKEKIVIELNDSI
eukprot:gene8994-12133_t